MLDLQNKTAVITGGASGIGLATARLLAAAGVQLLLTDVEQSTLTKASDELGAIGVIANVSSYQDMQSLADRAFDELGHVDIVFNNAGVAVGGPIAEMTHEDWKWIIDVDLWGPIHGVEVFLPRMIEQKRGTRHRSISVMPHARRNKHWIVGTQPTRGSRRARFIPARPRPKRRQSGPSWCSHPRRGCRADGGERDEDKRVIRVATCRKSPIRAATFYTN